MDTADDKRRFGFLKTTALGALLVVVPVGIVGFALWQVYDLAKLVVIPLFESLPIASAATRVMVILSALLATVLLCYFTGVVVRTRMGGALRRWIERRLLERIPGYAVIRSLAHQYLGHDDEQQFRPVTVDLYGSGTRVIGFEIEEVDAETVAIFVPTVPAATVGRLQFVPRERVSPLSASMHTTLETLTMFGVGSSKLWKGEGS